MFVLSDCGDPTPANGQATYRNGTLVNDTAAITCNTGYSLSGSSTITCSNAGWDDEPTCTIQG